MDDLVTRLRNHGDIISNEAADYIEELQAKLLVKMVKDYSNKNQRNAKVIEMWNSGMKFKAIADNLQISYYIVHRIINEARKKGLAINVWDRHNLTDP